MLEAHRRHAQLPGGLAVRLEVVHEQTLLGAQAVAEQCLFVDDLEANCEAARELGMTAVRFEHADQAIPELESALTQ